MIGMYSIVRKELRDLAGTRFLLIIGLCYVLIILMQVFNVYNGLKTVQGPDASMIFSTSMMFSGSFSGVISDYGVIIAIVVGFLSIASERRGNALCTLMTKPVRRRDVICGKMIGSLVYLSGMAIVGLLLFAAFSSIICGNAFNDVFVQFVYASIPVVIASLICALIFSFYPCCWLLSSMGKAWRSSWRSFCGISAGWPLT
jgi:hypothetical protein